jgi:NADH-quinone oxidoreductase E subunit
VSLCEIRKKYENDLLMNTMQFEFNEHNKERIRETLTHYPTKRAAVMPVLYFAQEQHGWISLEVMDAVAKELDIPAEDVLGVASFYTMYHKKTMGKYHLQICTNVSCMLRGGYEIYDAVREKYGLENWGVTDDRKFSLEEVECMGSCGTAPMMAVNETFYENLTKDEALRIITSLE